MVGVDAGKIGHCHAGTWGDRAGVGHTACDNGVNSRACRRSVNASRGDRTDGRVTPGHGVHFPSDVCIRTAEHCRHKRLRLAGRNRGTLRTDSDGYIHRGGDGHDGAAALRVVGLRNRCNCYGCR